MDPIAEYLGQQAYYMSDSRGKMLISDMHSSHASNAAAKLLKKYPQAAGSKLHNALLVQGGDVEGDPTFDRDGEEPF